MKNYDFFVNPYGGLGKLHNDGLDKIASRLKSNANLDDGIKETIVSVCASYMTMLDCICESNIHKEKVSPIHHTNKYMKYYQHIGYSQQVQEDFSINEICAAGEYSDPTVYIVEDIFSISDTPNSQEIVDVFKKIELKVLESERKTLDKDLLLKVLALGKASASYFGDQSGSNYSYEDTPKWKNLFAQSNTENFSLKQVVQDDMKGVFTKGTSTLVEQVFNVGKNVLTKGIAGTLASSLGGSAWSATKQLYFDKKS